MTGASCRDRAEERRKGLNPDYERVNLAAATGADLNQLSVEDSKFLGGDVEHTHLVKGLDFALLHKVCAQRNICWKGTCALLLGRRKSAPPSAPTKLL